MAYRLYLDESGDHTSIHPSDVGKRFLGIVGVAVDESVLKQLRANVEDFKRQHLDYDEDDPPILHREDILIKRGPFHVLADPLRKRRFNEGLLDLLRSIPFTIIAVVIDKHSHASKTYRELAHPYHYCLHAMADRYCGKLSFEATVGDVVAEARGTKEDTQLKQEYARMWDGGTRYSSSARVQRTLRSRQLKLKPKSANIAGLQVADVLAHPVTRDVLMAYGHATSRGGPFADRVCEAIARRYNRRYANGQSKGYGKVFLD